MMQLRRAPGWIPAAALSAAAVSFTLTLSGCDAETEKAVETIIVKAADAVGLKIQRQEDKPAEGAAQAQAPAGQDDGLSSDSARQAKANAELLQEVYRVVYM